MGAGRITGSDITAQSHPAQSQKMFKNYRPVFEDVMRSNRDLAGAPQKLSDALCKLMENAKARGVDDKVNAILKMYATEINNDIVLLMLRRLNNLVENSHGQTLAHRLDLTEELMRRLPHEMADTVPELIMKLPALISGDDSGKLAGNAVSREPICDPKARELLNLLNADAVHEIFLGAYHKTKANAVGNGSGPCPDAMSSVIKTESEQGQYDHIGAVAIARGAMQETAHLKNPTAASGLSSIEATPMVVLESANRGMEATITATLSAGGMPEIYIPPSSIWSDQPKGTSVRNDDIRDIIASMRGLKDEAADRKASAAQKKDDVRAGAKMKGMGARHDWTNRIRAGIARHSGKGDKNDIVQPPKPGLGVVAMLPKPKGLEANDNGIANNKPIRAEALMIKDQKNKDKKDDGQPPPKSGSGNAIKIPKSKKTAEKGRLDRSDNRSHRNRAKSMERIRSERKKRTPRLEKIGARKKVTPKKTASVRTASAVTKSKTPKKVAMSGERKKGVKKRSIGKTPKKENTSAITKKETKKAKKNLKKPENKLATTVKRNAAKPVAPRHSSTLGSAKKEKGKEKKRDKKEKPMDNVLYLGKKPGRQTNRLRRAA